MQYGLLLAPGAGASSDAPGLVAVEESLRAHVFVRRMDFPYRLAGRKAPDRAPKLIEAVVDAAKSFVEETGIEASNLFLGGRSMGGRMCSMAVAEGLEAAGLVLMSYPLHPPGRPKKLRVDHFEQIRVPSLFVSGTRDAFGTTEEFEQHISLIPADVTTEWIEGGDHGMAKQNQPVTEAVTGWLLDQIASN